MSEAILAEAIWRVPAMRLEAAVAPPGERAGPRSRRGQPDPQAPQRRTGSGGPVAAAWRSGGSPKTSSSVRSSRAQ